LRGEGKSGQFSRRRKRKSKQKHKNGGLPRGSYDLLELPVFIKGIVKGNAVLGNIPLLSASEKEHRKSSKEVGRLLKTPCYYQRKDYLLSCPET
jgi:hypothetical protein